ncbi:hypothetical protein [Mycolicibacterium nivoides]|uniref:hypothetical protein n=1 Tax=Mycolicibacterium nivoides TaxID=2487344 RepID=UPI003C2B0813
MTDKSANADPVLIDVNPDDAPDEATEIDSASEDSQFEVSDEPDDLDGEAELPAAARRRWKWRRRVGTALAVAIVVALGAFIGYLGSQLHRFDQVGDQRAAFLQAAREGAVDLTSIDWQHADDDVTRILDSATGTFHDDFERRSKPFIDVVKKVRSKTEGTVTMAGLESISSDQARALVAVTVKTSSAASPETTSKAWRMRIDVERVGDEVKVANVEFVP